MDHPVLVLVLVPQKKTLCPVQVPFFKKTKVLELPKLDPALNLIMVPVPGYTRPGFSLNLSNWNWNQQF
jgi:hypothetical protein